MKKPYSSLLLFLSLLIAAGGTLYAQTPQYEKCCGTSSSQFPFKNNGGAKTQFWYNPADFTVLPPSGMITTIYFRSQFTGQAGGYDDFKILMKQPATGTQFSTATTFETGMIQVHSSAHDSITGATTVGGWYAIALTTPFSYNNTLPLVVEVQYTAPFYGVGIDNYSSSTTSWKKIYASSASATTGTASNGFWQDFGMDIVTVCTSPPTPGTAVSTPNPACQGNSVTLDLTGHTFGTGQTYQWQEATSAGGPYTPLGGSQPTSSYTFVPATAKYYRAVMTCSAVSDTSAPVHVPVSTPVAPAVSIVTDTNNFCQGTLATFTATPVNGGLEPIYQWKRNGVNVGTDTNIFSASNLLDDDTITCEIISSDACLTMPGATSNKIIMSVISKLPTSVTVVADPSTEICQGDSVAFTATPVNGGTAPAYQWKKNGVNVGTNSPVYGNGSLQNNDIIRCEMSSSEECVTQPTTGQTILMKVNPLPAKPLIQINGLLLTSSETAEGYRWSLNGTPIPGDTTQTITALDSGWYSVTVISDKGCEITSNPVFSWGVVGIGEYSSNAVKVYPSPFEQEVFVDFATGSSEHTLEIRNMAGQLIHRSVTNEKRSVINMSVYDSGVYFITVKWDDQSDTRRIVKK